MGGGNRVEALTSTPSRARRPSRAAPANRHSDHKNPALNRRKSHDSAHSHRSRRSLGEAETMMMMGDGGVAPHQHHPHHQRLEHERRRRRAERRPKRLQPQRSAESTAFITKLARALLGRLLFVSHSLITIWQTVDIYADSTYWGFSLISIAILIEGAITIIQRGGDERKWLCPSVLLFILATAPPIWLLESDLSSKRLAALTRNGTQAISKMHHHAPILKGAVELTHELWVQLLEQFMLVILIIGRWLLPKGEITREQLSQILLAFLAIASDIVELFDLFKEIEVTKHSHLRRLVLVSWSMSLIQFGFVLTTSKARKMRVAITHNESSEDLKRIHRRMAHGDEALIYQILRDSDIWAIILANFLQDVPFLFTRLYLMIGYDVFGYTMIFFTCKNALIIALQTYRLVILVNDRYRAPAAGDDDAKRLAKHYRQTLAHCKDSLAELRQTHPHLLPPLKGRKRTEALLPHHEDVIVPNAPSPGNAHRVTETETVPPIEGKARSRHRLRPSDSEHNNNADPSSRSPRRRAGSSGGESKSPHGGGRRTSEESGSRAPTASEEVVVERPRRKKKKTPSSSPAKSPRKKRITTSKSPTPSTAVHSKPIHEATDAVSDDSGPPSPPLPRSSKSPKGRKNPRVHAYKFPHPDTASML